ncbi:MAG: spore coat protein GerQ [Candidatus Coprovivens sp.]
MNGNFYKNPTFPTLDNKQSDDNSFESGYKAGQLADISMQQSYIENILRHNKGKKVRAYVSFPDSEEWRDRVFEGTIEQAGRDHLIIRDPKDDHWYLILMIYLNYVEFDEKIAYSDPNIFD